MSERAERLRERVTDVLRDAVARPNANPDRVLRAIVEELGVTAEMLAAPTEHHARARIEALATLLEASKP